MNWYKETRLKARKHYKHYKLFLALLAATSPRKSLSVNMSMARRLYRAALINPYLYKFSKHIIKEQFSLMDAHLNNVMTIVSQ